MVNLVELKLFIQKTMGSVDEEIFEITDFTCVTDWERFVNDLESRIRDWQLNDEAPTSATENDGFSKKKKVGGDEKLFAVILIF